MIRHRLVLILGAAASAPYSFPMGRQLHDEIRDHLASQHFRRFLADSSGADEALLSAFQDDLWHANRPSIDAFLSARQDYVSIGKAAIAALLLPRERDSELDRPSKGDGWYSYLFDKMAGSTLDDFVKNELSVVTFNFDRSLERALFRFVKGNYGVSDEDAKAAANVFRIVHAHGDLGRPNWLASEGIAYGTMPSPQGPWPTDAGLVRTAASRIQILHERFEPAIDAEVQQIFEQAESVCFLGFGYHLENLRKLRVSERSRTKFEGTWLDISNGELQPIHQAFGKDRIHLRQMKILDFLRETTHLHQ